MVSGTVSLVGMKTFEVVIKIVRNSLSVLLGIQNLKDFDIIHCSQENKKNRNSRSILV